MTIETQEPVADLTVPDEWLDALLPQKLDQATDRCDICQAQALHAWSTPSGLVMMCNHHAREESRWIPGRYAHRDYRMPVEEAEALNAKSMADAQEQLAKPVSSSHTVDPITRAGAKVNDEYREVPRHLTQWDLAWWGGAR